MGICKICGEKYGLMSGGTEPYTGHNLTICNSCGQILKDIEQSKAEDTKEVKELCASIIDMAQDEYVRNILSEYSETCEPCEPCNSHKKALLPEAYFDKVNRTFVFQMNKKYSHNLLWKLSKLFIGRLEKQV